MPNSRLSDQLCQPLQNIASGIPSFAGITNLTLLIWNARSASSTTAKRQPQPSGVKATRSRNSGRSLLEGGGPSPEKCCRVCASSCPCDSASASGMRQNPASGTTPLGLCQLISMTPLFQSGKAGRSTGCRNLKVMRELNQALDRNCSPIQSKTRGSNSSRCTEQVWSAPGTNSSVVCPWIAWHMERASLRSTTSSSSP